LLGAFYKAVLRLLLQLTSCY